MPDLTVYTDGGARGNPGPAAIGIVIRDEHDRPRREHKEYLGVATSNEAEYRALIKGLALAASVTDGDVSCISDSQLMIRQMRGEYRVREPRLQELHRVAMEKADAFNHVSYEHRPRLTGWLRRADELVNEALDLAERRQRGKG